MMMMIVPSSPPGVLGLSLLSVSGSVGRVVGACDTGPLLPTRVVSVVPTDGVVT